MPSRCGFMVFQGPLATYRNSSGREVQIVAVSWGPWHDPLDHPAADGLQLTFYSHPTLLFPRSAFTAGTVSPDAAALLNPVLAPSPAAARQ